MEIKGDLKEDKVERLLLKYSIPAIMAMMVASLKLGEGKREEVEKILGSTVEL
ncbi:hypothetical protein [Romboutsia lituseburensis]|uniref:hypothetical protein n=1 Tax=Romboutsia lituseburensis TaxID=1537 RepID=UPI002ED15829